MSDEMKARSFRMTDEIAEKFRAICNDFPNQNVALQNLITAYEVQNASVVLTDRQTDITDYNSHIQALQTAFLHSLEITENAETRIRTEFQKQLASKDQTIQELQERLQNAEVQKQIAEDHSADMDEKLSALSEETAHQLDSINEKLQSSENELRIAREQIADKQALLDEKSKQLMQMQQDYVRLSELESKLKTTEQAQQNAENTVKELQKQLAEQEQKYTESSKIAAERAELALQKALLAEQQKTTEKAIEQAEKIASLYQEISSLKEHLTKSND